MKNPTRTTLDQNIFGFKTSIPLVALFCVLSIAGVAHAETARSTVALMHKAAVSDDLASLDKFVAYDKIARASLAKNWSDFTEQEQRQFLGNFRQIVRRTYQKGLGGKSKKPLNITGESAEKDGKLVHTTVNVKDRKTALEIDYLMQCASNACQLVDVVTDGTSLVKSWKRMFRRILKKHGKAELLSRIEKKAKAITTE